MTAKHEEPGHEDNGPRVMSNYTKNCYKQRAVRFAGFKDVNSAAGFPTECGRLEISVYNISNLF